MSYVGKITASGTTYPVGSTLYGTCGTDAATAAKVATVSNFDTLETGITVHIKFTNSNTVANPTLAIKPSASGTATTAKNIYKYGTTAPGTTAATSWQAGSVVSFTYDGSYWQMNDHLDDTNTQTVSSVNSKTGAVSLTASDVGALASSTNVNNVSQTDSSTSSNYRILLSNSANDTTETAGVRKNSKLTYNPDSAVLSVADQGKSVSLSPGTISVSQAGNSTVSITQSEISISSYPSDSISITATGLTGNVTGDLNGKVKQSATSTSTNSSFPILFSGSTTSSVGQYNIYRQANLTYNPSTGALSNVSGNIYCTGASGSSYSQMNNELVGVFDANGVGVELSDDNSGDIYLTGEDNTWDGTNDSLRTAISLINTNISNKNGYGNLWINSGTVTCNGWTQYVSSGVGHYNDDLFTNVTTNKKGITVKKSGNYLILILQRYSSIGNTSTLLEFGLWDQTSNSLVSNAYTANRLVAYETGHSFMFIGLTAGHTYGLAGNTKNTSNTISLCQVIILPMQFA